MKKGWAGIKNFLKKIKKAVKAFLRPIAHFCRWWWQTFGRALRIIAVITIVLIFLGSIAFNVLTLYLIGVYTYTPVLDYPIAKSANNKICTDIKLRRILISEENRQKYLTQVCQIVSDININTESDNLLDIGPGFQR